MREPEDITCREVVEIVSAKVVAPSGRLVRRLRRWNEEGERAVAEALVGRVRNDAASRPGEPRAAGRAGGAKARRAERASQADRFRTNVLE